VGEALDRISKLRAESKIYFARGDKFWGTRILLWELHYVQDLHQPFHVMQVPSLKMLPWKKLFSGINKAATHSIGNYHYAYEGLALEFVKEARSNEMLSCLEQPADLGRFGDPEEILFVPREYGNELGAELFNLFGEAPKSDTMDLPNGVGQIDYFAIVHMPEPKVYSEDEMKNLSKDEVSSLTTASVQWKGLGNVKRITCELMKSVSRYTWNELDFAFLETGAEISKKRGK